MKALRTFLLILLVLTLSSTINVFERSGAGGTAVYTSTEVDGLFGSYYTKTQVDSIKDFVVDSLDIDIVSISSSQNISVSMINSICNFTTSVDTIYLSENFNAMSVGDELKISNTSGGTAYVKADSNVNLNGSNAAVYSYPDGGSGVVYKRASNDFVAH